MIGYSFGALGTIALLCCAVRVPAITYYLRTSGNDAHAGTSPETAWRTLKRASSATFQQGDTLLLEGGARFEGSLEIQPSSHGTEAHPITIGSFGKGRATLHAGNGTGISLKNTSGIVIKNLHVVGAWDANQQAGNEGHGILAYSDLPQGAKLPFLRIENVEVSGFKQGGIVIGAYPADKSKSGFVNIRIARCLVHDNGDNGIRSYGYYDIESKGYAHQNVAISHCEVYNNRGLVKSQSHTGNGIVLSDVEGAMVERCVAHHNGEFSPLEAGGGPVGIWAWDATKVTLQHNESYSNKGRGIDGGGFDLDGGVTHSVMQYNYSHDNNGAGYLLAQFGGRPMHHLTIRFNISENDGRRNSYAGIQIWDGLAQNGKASDGLHDCEIYNNTIFTSPSPEGKPRALYISTPSRNIHLRNNLFVTTNGLPLLDIAEGQEGLLMQGNAYWGSGSEAPFVWAGKVFPQFTDWQAFSRQEMLDGKSVGIGADPQLNNAGQGRVHGNPDRLTELSAYRLRGGSPLQDKGLDLKSLFGIDTGSHDFYGGAINKQRGVQSIGAHNLKR